jgi:hypothetical protein
MNNNLNSNIRIDLHRVRYDINLIGKTEWRNYVKLLSDNGFPNINACQTSGSGRMAQYMRNKTKLIKMLRDADFNTRFEACIDNDIDFEELLTEEEIKDIHRLDDFSGDHHIGFAKIQKLDKINKYARELMTLCENVVEVKDYNVVEFDLNAHITVVFNRTVHIQGKATQILSEMTALSDSVFIFGLSETNILYNFIVRDVWEK